jgi:hypothetical protein
MRARLALLGWRLPIAEQKLDELCAALNEKAISGQGRKQRDVERSLPRPRRADYFRSFLSAHSAALGDFSKDAITLGWSRVRDFTRHGGRAWRHDNRDIRMTFANSA